MDTNDKIIQIISDIESRAKKIHLPIAKLCDHAGSDISTFTRWKSKKTKPLLETYLKITLSLEHFEEKALKIVIANNG